MLTVTIRLDAYQMQCIMPCLPNLPFYPIQHRNPRRRSALLLAEPRRRSRHNVPFQQTKMLRLSLGTPDALEETIPLCQSVHGIVALGHGADESRQGVDVVLAGDLTAVLVDLGNGDLDGSVVLGLNNAVGGGTLAGDVTIRWERFKLASTCQFIAQTMFQ